MDDPDQKLKIQLGNAQELFESAEYSQCRKLLGEIKATHLSIQLNSLLCEYKENPQRLASVLKKIMDILVTINIKIYQQRPQNQIKNQKAQNKMPKISHQFYFWNIIVLAQLVSNPQIAQLVANEALHFTDKLRTQTSLMILYQMLSTMQTSNRLASCIQLIEKQNRLISRVKKLTYLQQGYRFMNQILFCKVLLKLSMIEESRLMYKIKFNQNGEQGKEQQQLSQINAIPIKYYQQLLNAEIQFHAKNYPQSLKILGDMAPQIDNLASKKQFLKNIIDHNLALVLINYRNVAPAQLLLKKVLSFLTSSSKQLQLSNLKGSLITKCKENLLLSTLASGNQSFQKGFQLLKQTQNAYSYKINYRKAQICLNYYHQLLRNPEKIIPYKDIHDFYQTVYYYPNLPYFQQKGKNKNPNYTNGKFSYRRYLLTPWQHEFPSGEEFVSVSQVVKNEVIEKNTKETQERNEPSKQKKNQKGVSKNKKGSKKEEQAKEELIKEEIIIRKDESFGGQLRQILNMTEWYLKEALIILQKEKSIIVNFQQEEKGFTEQVNQKLYNEYITFKSSMLSLLCYIYLCKREWIKTVRYAEQYHQFEKQYQFHAKNSVQQKIHYNVLTYQTEAYCELNRIEKAYEKLQDTIGVVDYTQKTKIESRSTSSHQRGQIYFEKSTQYNNFGYNLSVLHSRDNKIPEAYNSIQKLLQQMRIIPSNPTANLPLSLIELLIHYNMRTGNAQSALQMVKRRRILNLPGVIGHYQPILNITK